MSVLFRRAKLQSAQSTGMVACSVQQVYLSTNDAEGASMSVIKRYLTPGSHGLRNTPRVPLCAASKRGGNNNIRANLWPTNDAQ